MQFMRLSGTRTLVGVSRPMSMPIESGWTEVGGAIVTVSVADASGSGRKPDEKGQG